MLALAGHQLLGVERHCGNRQANPHPQSHWPEASLLAMTQAEVERIAKTAAHEAVKETLQTLGFDVSEPIEVQQDQAFLRTMRVGTRKSIFTALTAFITAIVTLVAGALWLLLNKPH